MLRAFSVGQEIERKIIRANRQIEVIQDYDPVSVAQKLLNVYPKRNLVYRQTMDVAPLLANARHFPVNVNQKSVFDYQKRVELDPFLIKLDQFSDSQSSAIIAKKDSSSHHLRRTWWSDGRQAQLHL